MLPAELPGYSDAALDRALDRAPDGAASSSGASSAAAPLSFRASADGFVVDEVPLYLPSGAGDHLYLHVEKRGLSTPALVELLCRRLGVHERDVGYAGRKDERGVTRQWISVPRRAADAHGGARVLDDVAGVRVLDASPHRNKLRLGHLSGNTFRVVVEGEVDVDAVRARAAPLGRGVPNLFGRQRFGRDDGSLREAVRFVERRLRARSRRETFWVSIVQSSLFNAWLADRVDDGTWQRALVGDVLLKVPSGAPFLCDDPATDTPRIEAGEVVVGGPLFGAAMRPAQGDALTRESRSLLDRGVDVAALMSHPAFDTGARRPASIRPADLSVEVVEGGVALRFFLPKGSYASVVLRAWLGPRLIDAAFADVGTDIDAHAGR